MRGDSYIKKAVLKSTGNLTNIETTSVAESSIVYLWSSKTKNKRSPTVTPSAPYSTIIGPGENAFFIGAAKAPFTAKRFKGISLLFRPVRSVPVNPTIYTHKEDAY